jgi:hypothetical protein
MTRFVQADEDRSVEHLRSMEPTVDLFAGRRRICARRLRVSYEPGDLSEVVVEYTTPNGKGRRDPRNRVLLLEDEDLVWLAETLGPIAERIRGERKEPGSKRLRLPVKMSGYDTK